ncbi:hypothetical protein [Zavarzinella formosa]|uniref:hypothetical protein n=1 Tax=Zavarzinella formosa TaxID=360055 RepID=UPI0002FE8759|nr:hypothetical protein [Zavarzinella formosa]
MESPHGVFNRIVLATSNRIEAIRVIRQQFGLDLRQAKEVMLQAEGVVSSLNEHQEHIAVTLEQGFQKGGKSTDRVCFR